MRHGSDSPKPRCHCSGLVPYRKNLHNWPHHLPDRRYHQQRVRPFNLFSLLLSILIVLVRLDWGTRDKRERERERERWEWEVENERVRWTREKKCKIINERPTVTVHICTVTVAIVYKCTILHPLIWVFFWVKMCKMGNFFYFAWLYTCWCGC